MSVPASVLESGQVSSIGSDPPKTPAGNRFMAGRVVIFVYYLLIVALLVFGYRMRSEELLTAESGLGYALGILGGSLMLLLLIYPLRKRIGFMRHWGAVRHWFRLHMACGILGPVCILFHCNFSLGSVNSNMALFSMLTVAVSGLIGRYVYTRIHHGLYGRRANLAELQQRRGESGSALHQALEFMPEADAALERFEKAALLPWQGFIRGIWRAMTLYIVSQWVGRRAYRDLKRSINQDADRPLWDSRLSRITLKQYRTMIRAHLGNVRRVAEFTLYERMFALWHVLHIPLFILLLIAGIAHVFAVHVY